MTESEGIKSNNMNKFNLGEEAKDKITGFKGILTGYMKCLTGCDQYCIQPKCEGVLADKLPEANWIDEGRVELIEGIGVEPGKVASKSGRGSCCPAP
jgi:hypothetical protein